MKDNKHFYNRGWLLHDTWSFHEASYLLIEEDPDYVNEIYPPIDEVHDAARYIYRMALSCEADSLKVVTRSSQSASARVRPSIFIQWADKKGLNIPDSLRYLLNENHNESSDKLNNIKKFSMKERVIIIGDKANELFDKALNIPDKGKLKIWNSLIDDVYRETQYELFKSDWKQAIKDKLVKMEDHDIFNGSK